MQTDGPAAFCGSFAVASALFELLLLLDAGVKSCSSWCSSLSPLFFTRHRFTDALHCPRWGPALWAFSFPVFLLPLSQIQLWVCCLRCPYPFQLWFTTSVLCSGRCFPLMQGGWWFLSLLLWSCVAGDENYHPASEWGCNQEGVSLWHIDDGAVNTKHHWWHVGIG